jgi:peptidoglycan/LPS O-acetylase OafA/YrhL
MQAHAIGAIPSLVPHGYVAVDFFFVLSGFILCYTHLGAFARHEPGAYKDFLVRRFVRIMPLHVAVLGLVLIGGVVSQQTLGFNRFYDPGRLWIDLPGNILLLQGFDLVRNLNGPSWSISIEIAAYLGFPVLAALICHRWLPVRIVMCLAAILALVVVALQQRDLGLDTKLGWPSLLRGLSEFVLGMFTFAVWRNRRMAWLESDISAVLLFGAIGIAMILGVDLAVALLCPALIIACARNREIAASVLGSKLPHFLGVISYSVYLLHDQVRLPALVAVFKLHPQPLQTVPALGFALVGSLAVIPFAWLAYVAIERPGRNWGRRLLLG